MNTTPVTSTDTTHPTPGRVRPRLVAGLAATVALWPVLGAAGLSGLTLAAVVLPVTTVMWIALLGRPPVPRPVLTGMLAGLGYGAALALLAVVLGSGRPPAAVVLGSVWELTWAALLGAGAGVLGSVVQQARRRP